MKTPKLTWMSLIAMTLMTRCLLHAAPVEQSSASATEGLIRDSVVKISATLRYPDILHPWTKQSPREISGTGVVIDGKRILTNAHVVLYSSQLFVESQQSGDKLSARVQAVSPGMDLAVIKLDDESFFDRRPPLSRVQSLPEVKDSVTVYGYPQGGLSLSVTKGIVSRIEFVAYGEGASGVRIQVDAPINPGNSGGPALVDGKMIGLVFSKISQADNIGYIIPGEEIELFLKDIADGRYDGKPTFHDHFQTLENPALRGFLQLDKKTQGMIVHAPAESTPEYPLKTWDLVTRIGDKDIDNVGMVKVKDNLRLHFQYMIQSTSRNGKVPLSIIRQGKPRKIELPVTAHWPMLIESFNGQYPSYFVYGPLVFSAASREFCAALERPGSAVAGALAIMGSPLMARRGDRPAFKGEELVIVTSPMFPCALSKGYDNPFSKVVKEVNGVKVRNLRHFVELLRDTRTKYTTISFDDRYSETIVFDHQQVLKATDEILSDNGIRQQASDDLMAVWRKSR
ncbi:MAG: trypsin-like peptidase domain-containing protein [Isosphaeraceae bacterium]